MSYKRTKNRIPIQHIPDESESCSVVWMSACGFDASIMRVPPRAVWFNEIAVYKIAPYPYTLDTTTNKVSLTSAQETIPGEKFIYLNVPAVGFVSGSFMQIQQADGSELSSLSSAYFTW